MVRVDVSISKEQSKFLKDHFISPSQLFQNAIEALRKTEIDAKSQDAPKGEEKELPY